MLCQECRRRPATVHVTRITDGQRTEANLCESCARELGEVNILAEPQLSLQHLLASLLAHEVGKADRPAVRGDRCTQCDLSYDEFAKTGRLGCGHCYTQFEARLEPLLRRIHGASVHTGKSPARTGRTPRREDELAALRRELESCVRREEFERAANIRDRIRNLERPSGEG